VRDEFLEEEKRLVNRRRALRILATVQLRRLGDG